MNDFNDDAAQLSLPNKLPYVIHKRGTSKNYWMRFSIKGHGQQRIGLGTDDLNEAQVIAAEKYEEAIIKAKHDILEGRTSFDYLADQYVAELFDEAASNPNRLSNARYAKRICDRYLKPYFKRRTIASIGVPKVNAYLDWRSVFWTTGDGKDITEITYVRGKDTPSRPVQRIVPSSNTLKRESNILRGVFKHAVKLGHISMGQIPPINVGTQVKGRRPYFTKAQSNVVLNTAMERLHEVQDNPMLLHERGLLFEFVSIALGSGLRPIELFQLNWNHLEGFDPNGKSRTIDSELVILGYGKGKLPERSVPKATVAANFQAVWAIQQKRFEVEPLPDDPIFRSYSGKRLVKCNRRLPAVCSSSSCCGAPTPPFAANVKSETDKFIARRAMRQTRLPCSRKLSFCLIRPRCRLSSQR